MSHPSLFHLHHDSSLLSPTSHPPPMSVAPNMDPHTSSLLDVHIEPPRLQAPTTGNLTPAACMDGTHDDLLADLDGDLSFPDDPFPSLAEFSCLSSPSPTSPSFPSTTSSSSSTTSSCSSTSWPPPPPPPHQLFPSFDDLFDRDLWGSSRLLPDNDDVATLDLPDLGSNRTAATPSYSNDLAGVFLEWLRSNKVPIAPEDLRSIKLKTSTIQSAARHLGGGREGMMHLLKLILAWVQNRHLHGRRPTGYPDAPASPSFHPLLHVPATAGAFTADTNPVYSAMQGGGCMPPPEPAAIGDIYGAPEGLGERLPAWPVSGPFREPVAPPQYPLFPHCQAVPPPPYMRGGCGVPYAAVGACFGQGEQARVANSATKEARKKRMARQRRFMSLHHHRANCFQQQQQQCSSSLPAVASSSTCSSSHVNDWLLWSNAANGATTPTLQVNPRATDAGSNAGGKASQSSGGLQQNQSTGSQPAAAAADRRHVGWKSEKNLKFLLQKVLKQSDVGSLGRIVLPKKEAEIYLPELEARDGIPITMEDIGTSRTWNMRYRYWPNNKSRMYLLENTGDFVRSNGLQEGDFIVIYSDLKCGKYISKQMIRGVKVRKPAESKADGEGSSVCARSNGDVVGIAHDDYQE